nr:reverse transcriptase domain-containing protein [Tanacetum cinerariifolium]
MAASNHERRKSFSPWKQQEDKGKFKASTPMTTPVEKRNHAKFFKFHGKVGHTTDECMHLKKHIEEMIKVGKLSHLIKELKHNNGKEQPKVGKKGETSGKDKALAILMIGDEEHFTSAWINFVVVRSPSPYNGIIGRPRVRKLQAVMSIAHEMLKLLVEGGVITLKSSRMVPLECATVSRPKGNLLVTKQTTEERIKEGCSLVRQKKRGQAADRNQAIKEEVGKLVEGLKVCPDKVDAVLRLPSPKWLKDVQKLNEKLASLKKFLAKSAERL